MGALFGLIASVVAGVLLAVTTGFTALQLTGGDTSNDPALSAPLVLYGQR